MSKKLVAYFSASGVTESVARTLAQTADADLYKIQPEVPYTSADLDWMDKKSRSSLEMNDPASRPAIVTGDLDLSSYDVIFLGFPVWWYMAATIINTFLRLMICRKNSHSFRHLRQQRHRNSEKNLQQQYPSINWKSGKLLNGHPDSTALASWVKTLNI